MDIYFRQAKLKTFETLHLWGVFTHNQGLQNNRLIKSGINWSLNSSFECFIWKWDRKLSQSLLKMCSCSVSRISACFNILAVRKIDFQSSEKRRFVFDISARFYFERKRSGVEGNETKENVALPARMVNHKVDKVRSDSQMWAEVHWAIVGSKSLSAERVVNKSTGERRRKESNQTKQEPKIAVDSPLVWWSFWPQLTGRGSEQVFRRLLLPCRSSGSYYKAIRQVAIRLGGFVFLDFRLSITSAAAAIRFYRLFSFIVALPPPAKCYEDPETLDASAQ